MDRYSNMALRLSGKKSTWTGVIFFVYKSLLGIKKQKKLHFTILTESLKANVS